MQASTDAVYKRVGDDGLLIHLESGRVFELNGTAARFWDLLSSGHSKAEIEALLLQEFEVSRTQLAGEMEALLREFEREGLIISEASTR